MKKPVNYDHQAHRYYLGNRTYRSSTQIVEQFVEPFNQQERAEYMADRYGNTPEYWLKKWGYITDTACRNGTDKHDKEEQFLYNKGFSYVNGRKQPVYKIADLYDNEHNINNMQTERCTTLPPYYKLPDGVYPELKLWNHEWGIAGRSDKPTLETIGSNRYAHIEDYKTSKKIDKTSVWEKTMLEPISHLQDCEFIHYALQLSLYMFMFEGFGFQPGTLRLIHFPHPIPELPGVPRPVEIEVPYLRNEVILMLKHLRTINWLN
jgi:hypothetical protein